MCAGSVRSSDKFGYHAALGFKHVVLSKLSAKRGGMKRTMTSAGRNVLASSQGGGELISYDEHG